MNSFLKSLRKRQQVIIETVHKLLKDSTFMIKNLYDYNWKIVNDKDLIEAKCTIHSLKKHSLLDFVLTSENTYLFKGNFKLHWNS